MPNPNDLFSTMVREAMKEVTDKGWPRASAKAVTLAAFGMLAQKIDQKLDRITLPAYIVALSVAGSALWYIISSLLNLGQSP